MMDEKVMAVVGAAAVVTLAGRGMRPLAKMVMRGVVAASEATAAGQRGLQELYSEVKAERAGAGAQGEAMGATQAPAARAAMSGAPE